MAYPTTLAFKQTTPVIGATPIGVVDTTQRHNLGAVIRAADPVYGEAEFIYLKGVASTAAGDLVIYDDKADTTTRTTASTYGPVAVAMAAVLANQFGWYMIAGSAVVSTASAGTGAANNRLKTTATAGQATVSGTAANKVDGAYCTSAQDAPGAGFTVVEIARPSCNGNT